MPDRPPVETRSIAVDTMIFTDGESVLVSGECDRWSCIFAATDGTARFTLEDAGLSESELREFDPDNPASLVEVDAIIGTRDGVTWFRQSESGGDFANVYEFYGGWMEETAFGVALFSDEGATAALSIGIGRNPSNSNPIGPRGGATWTGAMAAGDVRTLAIVEGVATLDIDDLARPDVDVAFTRIHDIDTGARRPAIRWTNVPLGNGVFTSQAPGSTLQGRFYGAGHAEAAGVFERDSLVGSFGAARN